MELDVGRYALAVLLREIEEGDLQAFYEHQRDPEAYQTAAFTPRELDAFLLHWRTKILGQPTVLARTIVVDGVVRGYVSTYSSEGRRLVAYWVDRQCWGKGVASRALGEFVSKIELARPLDALVATANVGSRRVLEKCGFTLVAGSAEVGPDGVEEVRYQLP